MVKHMGYRIELSDVEHAILVGLSAVRNVCVVYANDSKEIIAYCELNQTISLSEFRVGVSRRLPSYMVPSRLVEVEQMPMNANGKIDRLYFNRVTNG
jgi:acyl-coenzyme A synthetase/AMP-(fatty) acid ligase